MADTLTITISPEDAEKLQQLAAETGESVEALASRILSIASDFGSSTLSEEQHAELRRRLENPGPPVSPERSAAILRKFGVER